MAPHASFVAFVIAVLAQGLGCRGAPTAPTARPMADVPGGRSPTSSFRIDGRDVDAATFAAQASRLTVDATPSASSNLVNADGDHEGTEATYFASDPETGACFEIVVVEARGGGHIHKELRSQATCAPADDGGRRR